VFRGARRNRAAALGLDAISVIAAAVAETATERGHH
jgi:hypothetical protein